MEAVLEILQNTLQSVSTQLQGPFKDELLSRLHDHGRGKLPDAQLSATAKTIVDLMGEIERILEPSALILADHFLGAFSQGDSSIAKADRLAGYLNGKCLCAAVELDIPDVLGAESKTVAELAEECNANPRRLRQVLRVLHNDGIFDYDSAKDAYRNNHTSELLLKAHWTQWRNWIDLYGNNFYDMARGIPKSLKSDQPRMAGQINYDTDLDMFTYFASQNWVERLHRTLGGGATAQAPGILQDYPWEELAHGTVLDVGGGEGALLALILGAHPTMMGALFDTERVISHAKPLFEEADGKYAQVSKQISVDNFIVGNFLESVPSYEFYTMKWCLHDWDDEKAEVILCNIRKSIKPGPESRLVVLESILADGRASRLSRYADITMMISANGEERNERQWRALAEKTAWKVSRIFPLRGAWPQAIELRPAE